MEWWTNLSGARPIQIACDTTGNRIAVLVRTDENRNKEGSQDRNDANASGRLVLLGADGTRLWDVDYEGARPVGLSLSASGQWASVALRDGSLFLYELVYGAKRAKQDTGDVLSEANAAKEAGNYAHAVKILQGRLQAVPADVQAYQLFDEIWDEWWGQTRTKAEQAQAIGDFSGAVHLLDEPAQSVPFRSIHVFKTYLGFRYDWYQFALGQGKAALAKGELNNAEAYFVEAITADPHETEARVLLHETQQARTEESLSQGREHLQAKRFAEALEAFTEARARGANGNDLTQLERTARSGEAMELGKTLYQDRQYAAALFQFQKVLRLNPDNKEAAQKADYARDFLRDTQVAERFRRLE
jgi:tetratricopeptide (TPR) repeat protein